MSRDWGRNALQTPPPIAVGDPPLFVEGGILIGRKLFCFFAASMVESCQKSKVCEKMQIRTISPEETEAVGRKLAEQLRPGDIIAYYGDLGAGKTAFTRGLAAGLGVTEQVTSPTYTIVNEYLSGRMPLFHFDMYRLDSADDLFDIGWEDYLARGGVCAVEWSENVEEALSGAIRITIHKDPADENVRTITIEGGERFADLGV